VTTADGRFTALMPHPERVFRNIQMSWTIRRQKRPQPLDADLAQRAQVGGLNTAGF
jgi:phosphoribosylformylglycinamidine (FGAM) synthase-like amidotransferase family enzyme